MIGNSVNNAVYVGATLHFKRRFDVHLSNLKHGKHSDRRLQYEVDRLGLDVFFFQVLHVYNDPSRPLRDIEQSYMDQYLHSDEYTLLNSTLTSTFAVSNQTQSAITVGVRLPLSLERQAEKKARSLGIKFPEYVRHLIATDTRDITPD